MAGVVVSLCWIAYGCFLRWTTEDWKTFSGRWSEEKPGFVFPRVAFLDEWAAPRVIRVPSCSKISFGTETLKIKVNELRND